MTRDRLSSFSRLWGSSALWPSAAPERTALDGGIKWEPVIPRRLPTHDRGFRELAGWATRHL